MGTLFVAFEDFILSREAQLCSPQTIGFYRRMLKPFLALANGSPPSNRMVREFYRLLRSVEFRPRPSTPTPGRCRPSSGLLMKRTGSKSRSSVRMPRLEQKRMEVLSRKSGVHITFHKCRRTF
ncbi:MAG: hypothetical protein ACC700_11010, partial [Anaerolineales bacterium]